MIRLCEECAKYPVITNNTNSISDYFCEKCYRNFFEGEEENGEKK